MRFPGLPLTLSVFAAALAVPAHRAHGNGRPAAVATVTFDPNAASRLVVGATFGTLISEDDGQSWRLICEGPIGTAGAAIDPIYRVTTTGTMLVASPNGVLYSRDGGCNFTKSAGSLATNQAVKDIVVSPNSPMHVLAASNTAGAMNGIHVSNDGGANFSPPANPGPVNTVFLGVRFGSSDGQRAYAMSFDGSSSVTKFYVSNDGGATFAPTAYSTTGQSPPFLIGADPRDPSKVYFHARVGQPAVSTLYRSTDGGASFQPVASDISTIFAATFAQNGTLYLATNGGIRKSPDGVSISPALAGATVVTCLGMGAQGALYGCGDTFADGFAIGKSTDEGAHWTPLLKFNQNIVGPLQCGSGTEECTMCYPAWPTFANMFGLPNQSLPMCMAGTGGSGGSGGSGGHGGGGGGCACALGQVVTPSPLGVALLAVAGAALIVRLRRRR
ncbi:MAG TPA: hypothetical protein VKN99_19940 [Polyangia bacterium]|nr:hypothetical protein [Polyangia bacterium]